MILDENYRKSKQKILLLFFSVFKGNKKQTVTR